VATASQGGRYPDECYTQGVTVLVSDCRQQTIIPEEYVRSLNLRSCIALPVRINNRPIGVVRFDSTKRYGAFQQEDTEFFLTLADQVGIVIGNARLLMEHQKAEQTIRESEERFRKFFEDLGDAVFVYVLKGNNQGKILEVNTAAEEQTGYSRSELISMNIHSDLVVEDSWNISPEQVLEKLEKGERVDFTEKKRCKDTSEIWTDVVITSIDYQGEQAGLSINHDITERRYLEEQLQQSQKMEAVGQLAGGIAHDFNNILTVISGFSSLLLVNNSLSEKEQEKLEHIQRATDHAEALTRQLLTFSRKQIVQQRILNVNAVIEDSMKIMTRLIGENIRMVVNLHGEAGRIKADPHQIEQVLMNLILNARDAVNARENQTDKIISIQTGMVHLDKHFLQDKGEMEEGLYLMLSVSDNGIGMKPEVVNRIFEPFFTTKGIGSGTGLGLSTIYGIIKQNKGHISVYSEPGKGTTFKIYWKAVELEEEKKTSENQTDLKKGSEHILLVEDDDGVRKFVREMLHNLGYKVSASANGKDALNKINNGLHPDLLITDLIMPGMNGYELSKKILKKYPDLRVIYSSGYTDDYIVDNGFLENEVNFVQKPYSLYDLSSRIREVLDT
jgi:PAS domain S-box-containing protein